MEFTFEDAVTVFDQEYQRSNGFGFFRLPIDSWDAVEVRRLIRKYQVDADARGAALTAMMVSVNMAEKLHLPTIAGSGGFYEGVPAYVADDCDCIKLFFGPRIPNPTVPMA